MGRSIYHEIGEGENGCQNRKGRKMTTEGGVRKSGGRGKIGWKGRGSGWREEKLKTRGEDLKREREK